MRNLISLLFFLLFGVCVRRVAADTERLLTKLPKMADHVVASADGKIIASSSSWSEGHKEDGQMVNKSFGITTICDAATGRVIRTLNEPNVNEIALSPNGALLAQVIYARKVQLWDVRTGKLVKTLMLPAREGVEQQIDSVVFSPNGKEVATATVVIAQSGNNGQWVSGTIQLWDVESAAVRREIRPEKAQIAFEHPVFSPNGKILAGLAISTKIAQMNDAEAWCEIRSWNTQTGAQLHAQVLSGRGPKMLGFTPKGGLLAAGARQKEIHLWNALSGQRLRTLKIEDSIQISIALSPNGKTLATGGIDSVIRLWDVKTGRLQRVLWGHGNWINELTFLAGSGNLVGALADGTVPVWDLKSPPPRRHPVVEPHLLRGSSSSFYDAAYSQDGSLFVTGGGGEIWLWDVKTCSLKRGLSVASPGMDVGTGTVTAVAISTDLQRVAARINIYGDRGTKSHIEARVWDAQTGQILATLPLTDKQYIIFSPDCRTLAMVEGTRTITLWNLLTGQHIRSWESQSSWLGNPQFSRDGTTLSVSTPQGLEWWDIATGRQTGGLAAGELLASSPEGQPLLTSKLHGPEGILQVWSTDAGKTPTPRFELNIGRDTWQRISISADGAFLAASRRLAGDPNQRNMEVLVWDLRTGAMVGCLAEPGIDPHILALSPDGKTLATPTGGTIIRLWDISRIQHGIVQ